MAKSLNPNAKDPNAKDPNAKDHDKTPTSVLPHLEPDALREPRRNVLYKVLSMVIGGLISVLPFGAGLVAFLDPLWGKKKVPEKYRKTGAASSDNFVRVTSLDSLAVGGTPQRFPVIDDKIDAWNFTPLQPIGAVFIQRVAADNVLVFNATCPHAGCSVACNGSAFNCPCHNSSFNLDGTKRVSQSGRENPSPRDMDSLVVDPNRLKDGEVWVEFVNYYTGIAAKTPKA